jgi:hypothetical protein
VAGDGARQGAVGRRTLIGRLLDTRPQRRFNESMRRLLVLLSFVAVALPAFAAPVVLEKMEAVSDPAPGVRLTLSAPVTPVAHPLRQPERITLDLPGTVLGPNVRQPLTGSGPLARVRTGQLEGGRARVVLDLTEHTPFTVETNGPVVTLLLKAAPAAAPSPAPAGAAAEAPAPAPAATAPRAVEPAVAASATQVTPELEDPTPPKRGLFLDYTGLLGDPDAAVLPEPDRQPHLHVGQP